MTEGLEKNKTGRKGLMRKKNVKKNKLVKRNEPAGWIPGRELKRSYTIVNSSEALVSVAEGWWRIAMRAHRIILPSE